MDKIIKKINLIPIAFDEETAQLINKDKIAWAKMIDRTIIGKCENIFIALGWDLSLIKEVKIKKEKITKPKREREIDRQNKEEER